MATPAIDATAARAAAAATAVVIYLEYFGEVHEDTCPRKADPDAVCVCSFKAMNEGVVDAIALLRAGRYTAADVREAVGQVLFPDPAP